MCVTTKVRFWIYYFTTYRSHDLIRSIHRLLVWHFFFFIIYFSLYYPSSLGPTGGPRESARRYSKPLCGFVVLARPPADQRVYKGRNWIFLILAGLRCLHAPCNQLISVFLWPARLNSIFLNDKTNSILLVVLSRYETTCATFLAPFPSP